MRLIPRLNRSKPIVQSEPLQNVVDSADSQRLRYARVLSGEDSSCESSSACNKAWKLLQTQMSLVPGGSIELAPQTLCPAVAGGLLGRNVKQTDTVDVASFHVDKMAVSNLDYLSFVRAGGYQIMSFWPQEIWPNVIQFVDQTGQSGPRWWRNGQPPKEVCNHPVVGICWYEASAYASWAGKTLPTSAQWQRAASWHATHQGQSTGCKYPWGETFENGRANLWASQTGKTVPVNKYPNGCTPNGVYQLIGNVWEWVDDEYFYQGVDCDEQPEWAEIRGGAFDTYMPLQATCHFRSGQQKLWREQNTGFRCIAVSSKLKHIPENI